ncbi:MAG: hypothetical protein OSA78_03220 [Flavobacteriales bacterium]|nr:hypothetical protein [Flavobacteriales bacterium]
MHIQRLQELIDEPGKTQMSDRDGLTDWVNKYPYSGVFSMLLARSSAVGGHIEQQNDLMRAAASSSLRQPLFDLILRTKLLEEARQIHAQIEAAPEVLEAEWLGHEEPAPVEINESLEAPEKTGLNMEDPMEREALISAIGRSIENDVDSWDSGLAPAPSERLTAADENRLMNAASSPFSTWLTARAREIKYGDATSSSEIERKEKPVDSAALIDRFIAMNPRIGPLRETAPDVHDLAQESVLEDATLVTETMARLYAKQGQIGKARKAYKLLALKNPAKSTYFASQLKKLGKGGLA